MLTDVADRDSRHVPEYDQQIRHVLSRFKAHSNNALCVLRMPVQVCVNKCVIAVPDGDVADEHTTHSAQCRLDRVPTCIVRLAPIYK